MSEIEYKYVKGQGWIPAPRVDYYNRVITVGRYRLTAIGRKPERHERYFEQRANSWEKAVDTIVDIMTNDNWWSEKFRDLEQEKLITYFPILSASYRKTDINYYPVVLELELLDGRE